MIRPLASLAALLAFTLAPALALAECAAGSLWAWPTEQTALPLRPLILLDSYGENRDTVASLAEGHHALLVGKGHSVPLVVEAVHIGARSRTQAVLRASADLKPGTRYVLRVQSAEMPIEPGKKPPYATRNGIASWTTTAETPAPLQLVAPPLVEQPVFRHLGCGPSSNMQLSVEASSGAPIAVEVELSEKGGAKTAYVVPLDGKILRIGHGMCSGAFEITGADRRFEARLTVRDAAGGRAKPETVRFGGVPREELR